MSKFWGPGFPGSCDYWHFEVLGFQGLAAYQNLEVLGFQGLAAYQNYEVLGFQSPTKKRTCKVQDPSRSQTLDSANPGSRIFLGPWHKSVRGPLMLRGPPIFIGPLTVWRVPDIQKDHWWWLWLALEPLIDTGALFFFSGGLRWSEGLQPPWCAFLSVSAQISWLLWWFRLLLPEFWPERAFGPRDLKTPRWAHPFRPPMATSD